MIIKDNIIQYRDLTETAFHRSFERDKDVLRKLGFEINYINDKWEINSGYEISGVDIWKRIKTHTKTHTNQFSKNPQNRNPLVLLVWQGSSVG